MNHAANSAPTRSPFSRNLILIAAALAGATTLVTASTILGCGPDDESTSSEEALAEEEGEADPEAEGTDLEEAAPEAEADSPAAGGTAAAAAQAPAEGADSPAGPTSSAWWASADSALAMTLIMQLMEAGAEGLELSPVAVPGGVGVRSGDGGCRIEVFEPDANGRRKIVAHTLVAPAGEPQSVGAGACIHAWAELSAIEAPRIARERFQTEYQDVGGFYAERPGNNLRYEIIGNEMRVTLVFPGG